MKAERPPVRQQLPQDIVADLMGVIRNSFYGDMEPKRWYQDQGFIRREVVCWPAGWLISRGVTLKPARYKEIVMGVITTIKQHGDTGGVKYWPRYLLHCLQMHFKCHGDEIYEEAKSLRTALENTLDRVTLLQSAGKAAVDPIEVLAMARKVGAPARRAKTKGKSPKQGELL
jgi:hypothetical protein